MPRPSIAAPTPCKFRQAAWTVRRGGLIAYPTEGVFGLGCNPRNGGAIARLLVLKGRSVAKGLILIAACFDQLEGFVKPPDDALMKRLRGTWPGPVTWLLPAHPDAPRWLRGEHETLAVRVTAHPIAAALCRELGMALVSTSANRTGCAPARSALAVQRTLGEGLDFILVGEIGGQQGPSEIRDAATGRVLRVGSSQG